MSVSRMRMRGMMLAMKISVVSEIELEMHGLVEYVLP